MEQIEFHFPEDGISTEEWTAAWNLCSNLEVLDVSHLEVERIQAVMAAPKRNLKEISIFYCDEFEDIENGAEMCRNVVADGTRSIEILHFENIDFPSSSVFDNFIDKNKDTLRSATIRNDEEALSLSEVDEVVEKFLECQRIEAISYNAVSARTAIEMERRGSWNSFSTSS